MKLRTEELETRVYTPCLFGRAQPSPQLTMPVSTLPRASGPPESPWQLSRPPASKPAQSMRVVIWPL